MECLSFELNPFPACPTHENPANMLKVLMVFPDELSRRNGNSNSLGS